MAAGSGMDVLLDAVRDRLRAAVGLTAMECDVCPDGAPNPNAGQRFVSVWGGSVSNSQTHCLDERYAFKVTVTVRTSARPYDRKRDGGAWNLALRCRAALHMSYDAMALATAADAAFVATEPPVFLSGEYLGGKGPDWFWAEPTGSERDPTGIAVELSFGRVRRIQYIGEEPPA